MVYRANGFDLVVVTPADFEQALDTYQTFSDKSWSFTDCTSFAIIKRLGLARAFSFEDHFRQVGGFVVVP